MASNSSPKSDTIIAILGATGAGKSSFIQTLTGQDVPLSHGLESSTTSVTPYTCPHPDGSGRTLTLLDTPGLDGSDMSDAEILQSISNFLDNRYGSSASLSGILFFHRISDSRLGGRATRALNTFRTLTGSALFSKVVFVTTMWDLVEPAVGGRRETAFRETHWRPMLARGARMERFVNTQASAMEIVLRIGRTGPSDPVNRSNGDQPRPSGSAAGAEHRPNTKNMSQAKYRRPYRHIIAMLGPATSVATAAIGWTAEVFSDWVLVGHIPAGAEKGPGRRSAARSWARTARALLRLNIWADLRPPMTFP